MKYPNLLPGNFGRAIHEMRPPLLASLHLPQDYGYKLLKIEELVGHGSSREKLLSVAGPGGALSSKAGRILPA